MRSDNYANQRGACRSPVRLAGEKREIIHLYFFEKCTQQEIGELYGRCRSTAWYHIHSALLMLRGEMEELLHEES